MEHRINVIHLIAGGTAGTTGAVLTCPLEVVKTRLQSSVTSFVQNNVNAALRLIPSPPVVSISGASSCHVTVNTDTVLDRRKYNGNSRGLVKILRQIIKTEGFMGLFKGLGPTLVGVAPSRAIYFGAYAKSKELMNGLVTPNTHFVHLCSASVAGISAVSLTNPIWFVKTRLQLDSKVDGKLTCRECIKRIYNQNGLRGFYKGISASYYGISETVIHLVVYEAVKAKLQNMNNPEGSGGHGNCKGNGKGSGSAQDSNNGNRGFLTSDYLKYMLAGACSKTFATCLCYPHEVARTRLREEGSRYQSFFQTLLLVYKEEGHAGVYRGLGTQLIRQIPNTAIVMATYEAVVFMLSPQD